MSIAAFVNWSANACIGFSYPLLDEAIGGKTFFIFAGLLLIFSIYTFFFVPETKGKSIREIQARVHFLKVNYHNSQLLLLVTFTHSDSNQFPLSL